MKPSAAVLAECSAVLCMLLLLSDVASTAPAPYDYDSVRDLYEVLLQREAMADNLLNQHRIVRKNNRSPSLRLRFGRRSDPAMYQALNSGSNIFGHLPKGFRGNPRMKLHLPAGERAMMSLEGPLDN